MDLSQTAIHEAGHVVVARALGLASNETALTHDEVEGTGADGHATGPNPAHGYERHGSRRERNAAMRAEAVACCAGLAAEHVVFGVPSRPTMRTRGATFRTSSSASGSACRSEGSGAGPWATSRPGGTSKSCCSKPKPE